jgi:adenylylsulfate reductase subunit A
MTTVKGLFSAGDGVGASGHKFSSGSYTEGRIAAKAIVAFVLDNADWRPELSRTVDELVDEVYAPVRSFLAHKDSTTTIEVNPHYITPKMLQLRLQKVMDEYAAGVSNLYQTNGAMLEVAERKLEMIKEDARKVCAKDLHELLRAWEIHHRVLTAEAHVQHVKYRQETRYPGYYYRSDYLEVDDKRWKCFVNSRYDRATGKWTCFKVPYKRLVAKREGEPEGIGNDGTPVPDYRPDYPT